MESWAASQQDGQQNAELGPTGPRHQRGGQVAEKRQKSIQLVTNLYLQLVTNVYYSLITDEGSNDEGNMMIMMQLLVRRNVLTQTTLYYDHNLQDN